MFEGYAIRLASTSKLVITLLTTKNFTIMANSVFSSISVLANTLADVKGATICTLVTATTPKMRKGGNPFLDTTITKICKQQMQFGYNYENAVNNRIENELGAERTFEAEPLAWGEWVVPNKIITHKGELYGRFYTMPNATVEVVYMVGNRTATAEEVAVIKSLEQKSGFSNRQAEVGLTDHQVQPRCYKLSNIVSLTTCGWTYNREVVEVVTR